MAGLSVYIAAKQTHVVFIKSVQNYFVSSCQHEQCEMLPQYSPDNVVKLAK